MAFAHKKSLGQHFLNNPYVPRVMCDAAHLTVGETVIEVGPGTGALTQELLARGVNVIALEADHRAIEQLEHTFATAINEKRLIIKHVDIRSFDLATLELADQQYSVVANIPYYLTGMLFRIFLEQKAQPRTIVFLTQQEVARRVTASRERGGKESLLSLSVKLYGTPHYIKSIPRGHFTPSPKVDSGIVAIDDISRTNLAHMTAEHFFTIVHLGFGQKRKQLLGNLAKVYPRDILTQLFAQYNLSSTVRAEDIALKTWLDLTAALPTQ